MHVTLAGSGCGGIGSMTADAVTAIKESDLIIGAQRLLDDIPDSWCAERISAVNADEIAEHIESRIAARSGAGGRDSRICVLYSGDSGFYSGAHGLIERLEMIDQPGDVEISTDVIPGISSVQMMSAGLMEPWQGWRLVSAHGRECSAANEVQGDAPVFFLTGGQLGPRDLCIQLADAGLGYLEVAIGERLGYDDERITTGTATELAGGEYAPLAVMLVRPAGGEDISLGIADERFIRDNVPMTKRNVRAAIIANMDIGRNNIIWDVGAGTGSVSVEMALQARGGTVYAIERDTEAAELTEQNRSRFRAWNIDVICGSAPDALRALPAPDKVFIGGSGGSIGEIIDEAVRRNPDVLICASAIVIETLHDAVEAMTRCDMDVDITQIAVSRSSDTGAGHMMRAENPVYIVTGRCRAGGEQDV